MKPKTFPDKAVKSLVVVLIGLLLHGCAARGPAMGSVRLA